MIKVDIDEILKKNKEKRKNYCTKENNNKNREEKKVIYLKGLISRTLITIIFVLSSMIFTNLSENNEKLYKKYVLEDSLGFTKISNLYKKVFGHVDILTPTKKENSDTAVFGSISYKNIENFKNSNKLTVGTNEIINVITSGIVVFIGEKEELGNTIIIQGNDGYDIWYSNITDTSIKIYDYIESGTILGTSNSEDIYLTISKDGKYLSYEEYTKTL